MSEIWLPCLLGLGLALGITPLSRRLALLIGAIDYPGERRIHTVATPRFGGPAIFLALIGAIFFAALFDGFIGTIVWQQWRSLGLLAIGALMITIVGAIDDVHPLRPVTKLLVEIAAASVAIHGGYRLEGLGGIHFGILAAPLSVFFLVSAVNAVNLVDGLDGLAVGMCLIISTTLVLICGSNGDTRSIVMMAALSGVLLGFIPYNFHPARIFLGDSGALLLGFLMGAGAIAISRGTKDGLASFAPFLALGLPLAELALTATRRSLRAVRVGRSDHDPQRYRFLWQRPALFRADGDHVHHRLLGFGLTHRRAVLLLYGACAASCTAAFVIASRQSLRWQAALLTAIIIASTAGVRWLRYPELMPLRSGLLLPLFGSPAIGRKAFQIVADAIAITSSAALAALIAGGWSLAPRGIIFSASMLLTAILQMAAFATSGLYRRSWRAAGLDDVLAITKALVFATALEIAAAILLPAARIGVEIVILDAYLLSTMMLGSRLSYRVLDHLFQRERVDARRVLIYGSGRAGAVALNEIRNNPALGMRAMGFIDDDARKCGATLQGVTVYGVAKVADLISSGAFDLVVLSSSKIKFARAQMMRDQCQRAGLEVLRFGIDWHGMAVSDASEAATPRRSSIVVPIRSANGPH